MSPKITRRGGIGSARGPVGVVLAGGASARMGRPKAALPFGDGTLLEWAVHLIGQSVGEVWISVSHAPTDPLPRGAAGVLVDRHPGGGPLAALRDALARFDRPVLFVACDLPFLAPADLAALVSDRSRASAVLLADGRGPQPLAALYRPSLLPAIERLLASGHAAMRDLIAAAAHRTLPASARDPGCPPLANLNRTADYEAALLAARACGLIPGRAAPRTSRGPRGASPRLGRGRAKPSPRA